MAFILRFLRLTTPHRMAAEAAAAQEEDEDDIPHMGWIAAGDDLYSASGETLPGARVSFSKSRSSFSAPNKPRGSFAASTSSLGSFNTARASFSIAQSPRSSFALPPGVGFVGIAERPLFSAPASRAQSISGPSARKQSTRASVSGPSPFRNADQVDEDWEPDSERGSSSFAMPSVRSKSISTAAGAAGRRGSATRASLSGPSKPAPARVSISGPSGNQAALATRRTSAAGTGAYVFGPTAKVAEDWEPEDDVTRLGARGRRSSEVSRGRRSSEIRRPSEARRPSEVRQSSEVRRGSDARRISDARRTSDARPSTEVGRSTKPRTGRTVLRPGQTASSYLEGETMPGAYHELEQHGFR